MVSGVGGLCLRRADGRRDARDAACGRILANRDQHRLELNDGIGYLLAADEQSRAIGLFMLEELRRARWTTDDDRAEVAAVIRVAKER